MADPTTLSIPRRRMALGTYTTSDSTLIALRDVGIINSAEATFNRETNEYRATDLSGGECLEYVADTNNTAGDGSLAVELMSNVAANLGVMLSSAVTTVAAAAADEETCPTVGAVNDVVNTNYIPDPDTIVITDSAGSPATLVLNTDYEFVAKNAGMIRILSLGAYTQPFLINYTKEASKTVSPMSDLDDYFYLVLAGGNERNSCGGESERFYRSRISDSQAKTLHFAADTKTPQPMAVTFTIDRDPARSYAFGRFDVTESVITYHLPDTRTGGPSNRLAAEVSQILDAGSGAQIGAAVRFVVTQGPRLSARNAMREAASRTYAASTWR